MRRRRWLAGAISVALVPFAARAQTLKSVYRIGWLGAGGPAAAPAAFLDRMRGLGYEPERTLIVESRSAEGDLNRLPELARELVALKPALLVTGSHVSALALKQATSSIPIIFRLGIDPVETKLVATLARPGGNLTGIFQLTADLFGKRLELLREFAPRARRVGWLYQRSEQSYEPWMRELSTKMGFEAVSLVADGPDEIRASIASAASQRVEAIMVAGGPGNNQHRQTVIEAVAHTRLPAIYPELRFAEAGGLIAYASDLNEGFARLADYAHRVLQGTKPADMPVEQSTRYQLVLNMKTANELGITIPKIILLRATRVIE